MTTQWQFYEYRVILLRDEETKQIVAEIPALDISDYGVDIEEGLHRLTEMAAFHLECLVAEGKPVPLETSEEEGVYLHVKLPAHAA